MKYPKSKVRNPVHLIVDAERQQSINERQVDILIALWEDNERRYEQSRRDLEDLKAYWAERDKKWDEKWARSDEKFDRIDEKFDRYDIRLNRLEFLLYLQILGAAALCVVPVVKFYFFGV